MIRQLGIPTFFITFSAADRRWFEINNAILEHLGRLQMTQEQHESMTWEEHCRIIMENPVIATIMFYNRVKSFIKDVIRSPANPIGKIVDYYYRTEFQQRGWPHIHMVAWVKDAPILDEDSDDEVIEFVDKYISCEMPPDTDVELHEIVSSVQTHSETHTKSCRKTGKTLTFHAHHQTAHLYAEKLKRLKHRIRIATIVVMMMILIMILMIKSTPLTVVSTQVK